MTTAGPIPLRGEFVRVRPGHLCVDCGQRWSDPSEAFRHVMAFGPAERAAKAERRSPSRGFGR